MPSLTPYLSLYKPNVDDPTDEDLWGGFINTNFDTIERAITRQQYSSPDLSPDTTKRRWLLNSRYPIKIVRISAVADSGTGTLTQYINGVAVTGSALNVSATSANVVPTGGNTGVAGCNADFRWTNLNSLTNATVTIWYDQTAVGTA